MELRKYIEHHKGLGCLPLSERSTKYFYLDVYRNSYMTVCVESLEKAGEMLEELKSGCPSRYPFTVKIMKVLKPFNEIDLDIHGELDHTEWFDINVMYKSERYNEVE